MQARGRMRKAIVGSLFALHNVVSFYTSIGVYNAARALRWLADKVSGAHAWVWNQDAVFPRSSAAVDVQTMIDALRRFREAYGSPVPFERTNNNVRCGLGVWWFFYLLSFDCQSCKLVNRMDNKQHVDQIGPDNSVEQQRQQLRCLLRSYKPTRNLSDEEICLVFGSVLAVVVVFAAMVWLALV